MVFKSFRNLTKLLFHQSKIFCFTKQNKIEIKWFTKTEFKERQKAPAIHLDWVVSRMYDNKEKRSVPAWRALNKTISIFDSHVTTAGMLPIKSSSK